MTLAADRTGSRIRELLRPFADMIREVGRFGVVGLICLFVDVGLFNLLMFVGGGGPLADKPLTAKAVSVIVATTLSYTLNRNWTFSQRGRTGVLREYVLFVALNGVAMLIALSVLWFSHYALGLTSVLADNISANVVGLALGTIFRFWSYRRWVFPAIDPLAASAPFESESVLETGSGSAATPERA
ncbi:MAG: GtrA family protein [Candidatus Nanopelagicales bacterium]|nr:GtrA family protein [Candidatus Nanopelagicales bacterium]MDZ4250756.1 GtrA family protein [Candidatus Nanopelagicales bacterium]MDZ7577991.1 GtrA family protein [Candidatus Nanopelagicales bacterium]